MLRRQSNISLHIILQKACIIVAYVAYKRKILEIILHSSHINVANNKWETKY